MNRTHVVALSIAGVLGVTGGTALALQQRPADEKTSASDSPKTPTATPTTKSSTPEPSPTPTSQNTMSGRDDSTYEPLLYAEAGAIHDGKKTIKSGAIKDPMGVGRVKGGYLVADSQPEFEGSLLKFVSSSGASKDVTRVGAYWDVNPTGDRIVGTDDQGVVTVWTLDGKAQKWSQKVTAAAEAAFVGDEVAINVVGRPNTDEPSAGYRWNPDTDKTVRTKLLDWAQEITTSPGGSYVMGGELNPNGVDGGSRCLAMGSTWLKKNPVDWRTCDWKTQGSSAFSPDGTRIVVEPVDTEGFGPGAFGIMDVTDGPGNMLGRFNSPDGAVGAVWGDNDHLYVFGARNADPEFGSGGFIDRCDLKGKCTRVTETPGKVAPGSIS